MRARFGLVSSPFLLGGVIEMHLNHWEDKEPELVAKIRKELYIDNLISGSTTVCKTQELKVRPQQSSKMLVSTLISGTQTSLSWN